MARIRQVQKGSIPNLLRQVSCRIGIGCRSTKAVPRKVLTRTARHSPVSGIQCFQFKVLVDYSVDKGAKSCNLVSSCSRSRGSFFKFKFVGETFSEIGVCWKYGSEETTILQMLDGASISGGTLPAKLTEECLSTNRSPNDSSRGKLGMGRVRGLYPSLQWSRPVVLTWSVDGVSNDRRSFS